MRRSVKLVLALILVAAFAPPQAAYGAPVEDAVSTFTWTKNMYPQGYSPRVVPLSGAGSGHFNSDLAFWGKHAFQGTYVGFRIIDIADPENPVEVVNYTDCFRDSTTADQGDIVVYGDILVRALNQATPAGGRFCGDVFTPANQRGVHVFDISDKANPVALTFVPTVSSGSICPAHTITAVPDTANNRLLIYATPSSNIVNCMGINIVEVPLDDPAAASFVRHVPSGETFAGGALVNLVEVHDGGAAGTYAASGSQWHPDATADGVTGPLVLVNAGSSAEFPAALPSEGCGPLIGFPAGAIALVDRGTCPFLLKVMNAEAAGAVGVIVLNNVAGNPTTMAGETHDVGIPSGMVSQETGVLIKENLPATGTLRRHPDAVNVRRACHDTSVIMGDVLQAVCAGGNGVTAWSIGGEDGGTLDDPKFMYSANHGTGIGHTAAHTWDGKYVVFGHEPGGGGQAQCQETSSTFNKTIWILDASTGMDVGHLVMPRPQTAQENCTWHNLNVVPTDKRYVFVSGNYQSGISVVDFTDVEHPMEIAYADPAPLNPTSLVLGGDWSTYWYNGRIYESDIRRGLIVWNLRDSAVAGAKKLPHLNPQTIENPFPFKGAGGR